MKIISKTKDFYDFMTGIYDTDDLLVYNRKTEFININYKHENIIIKNLNNKIKLIFNKFSTHRLLPLNRTLEYVVIGIYPNIYIMPFIIDNNTQNKQQYKYIFIPYGAIESLNKMKYVVDNLDNLFNKKINLLNESNLIFENNDIFKMLGVPTFIFFPDGKYGYLYNMLNLKVNISKYKYLDSHMLILNPVFNDYNINFIHYIYDDVIKNPVYTNIENFLYMIKQEPITEPDNNTKILNAGFDLKSSFRNIK